jgi:hypothetical protein
MVPRCLSEPDKEEADEWPRPGSASRGRHRCWVWTTGLHDPAAGCGDIEGRIGGCGNCLCFLRTLTRDDRRRKCRFPRWRPGNLGGNRYLSSSSALERRRGKEITLQESWTLDPISRTSKKSRAKATKSWVAEQD